MRPTKPNAGHRNLRTAPPFKVGNPGGPGNPWTKQVNQLRAQIYKSVTPEDIHDVLTSMLDRARAGDVAAASLLLSYALGKPPSMDANEQEQGGAVTVTIRRECAPP